jgi:adenylate kinase
LVAELPTFASFSLRGDPAKAKIAVLGPLSSLRAESLRSLNIEHVSPALLVRPEISRPVRDAVAREAASPKEYVPSELAVIGAMRRWFWARKPDAGFILHGFPATLLQAKLLDEWLEVRGERLSAIVMSPACDAGVTEYYHTAGCELFVAASAA